RKRNLRSPGGYDAAVQESYPFPRPMLHTRTVRCSLLFVAILVFAAASPAVLVTWMDELVLELDPETHFPRGDVVEAEGLIVDPRDLPERVAPYMNPMFELQGVEASLTGLFGRSLGFALERKKLAKRYSEFCKHQRDQWNELVDELRVRAAEEEEPVVAALYHDTGRRVTAKQMRIVGAPRLAMVPIDAGDFETLLQLQHDTSLYGLDMPKEAASRLHAVVSERMEKVEDPWFHHGALRLLMLSFGREIDDDLLANPWEMSPEEFLDRCKQAFEEALVDPLFPKLSDTVQADGTWLLEGLVVAEWIDGEDMPSHPEWEAHNGVVGQPWLHVAMQPKKPGKKTGPLKRARISMIAGGEMHELYDGKWPLK
ncbi:MAG: hypothetical protein AAF368_17705, partial [Planctomycetota bacterium]